MRKQQESKSLNVSERDSERPTKIDLALSLGTDQVCTQVWSGWKIAQVFEFMETNLYSLIKDRAKGMLPERERESSRALLDSGKLSPPQPLYLHFFDIGNCNSKSRRI